MQPLTEKINVGLGAVVTVLSFFFGEHYILFVGFLLLNAADYITGIYKARVLKKESSPSGAKGIWKKVMYWLVVAVAFGIVIMLQDIGRILGYDLSFVQWFGWLTLATYIINEFRSILENLVESGINVPDFLTKGLKVANNIINKDSKDEKEGNANG